MLHTDDLPPKSKIFEHWTDRLGELGFLIDWGEPSCWACGFHYDAKYDIRRSDASWDEILSCCEKIPLQRCHIVPRSLGGTNEVSNLFLMCRECHDRAPNTCMPDVFFSWAKSQSSWSRELSKLREAFESFGIDASVQESYCELILSKEFVSWTSEKYGLHRPQSNYASRSSRLTPSTIVGLAVHYRRLHPEV